MVEPDRWIMCCIAQTVAALPCDYCELRKRLGRNNTEKRTMSVTKSEIAARLCAEYKGIEGFYILNHRGELGYFSADGQRLVRETFCDCCDEQAADTGQRANEARLFFSRLGAAAETFPPDWHLEVGYLEPGDDSKLWRTATLVLHAPVLESLKAEFNQAVSRGMLTLDEGDRRLSDMTPERGLHRGMDDLLNHVGAFGVRPYLPVLYYRPSFTGDTEPIPPLRALNLIALLGGSGKFPGILATMRENLARRGALNRASRLEHRFTLQGETD